MIKKIFNELFEQLTDLGGLFFYGIIMAYFLINDLSVFYDLLFPIIIITISGLLIRYFYFKERPKKRNYNNLLEKLDAASFPSMHSARITALFIILQQTVDGLTKGLFFIITIIVLYSRINLRHHRITDVMGGIVLGIISSILLI